jgi:mutator protein MutT
VSSKGNKPHFSVTAGLIWQGGRLLITKRPTGSHLAGFWEFPGGKKEKEETLEECLEREIKEELGIEVKAERLLFTVNHEYEDRVISLYLFLCNHIKGQPEPLECQDILWVHPEELSRFHFPPPDRLIIHFLRERGSDDNRTPLSKDKRRTTFSEETSL